MSIRSLTHRVKKEVKCYGFWRKTSTAKTKETVSTYIMSYLDETSKAAALEESRKLGEGRKAGYTAVQHGVSAPQEMGIDYLTKEEKGKIRAYGFLRDDVAALGGKPSHQQDNDDRVIACHRTWMARLDEHPKGKKFAHKYVLSLDPRFCELMGAAGKDCDALLVQGARTVMRRFQEKFYPNDRIGYLVGVHHDRKHIHAHILLFPFSERGQHLCVTDTADDKRFHEVRKVADKFVRDYFFKEFESPVRASERPVDKVMQIRVVSQIAWKEFPRVNLPETAKMQWIANEKQRLLALPEAELRSLIACRQDHLLGDFDKVVTTLQNRPAIGEKWLKEISSRYVELRDNFQQVDGQIKTAKEQQVQLMGEFQKAQKELANFRFYTAKGRGFGQHVYEAETPEQRVWLTNLLATPATAEPTQVALRAPACYPIMRDLFNRSVLEAYVKGGKEEVRNIRGLLRAGLNARMEELNIQQEKVRVTLIEAYARRQGLLVALDVLKFNETIFDAAACGRKPLFLEQHEGMKRAGVELPILCRPVRPEDVVAGRETERAVTSFEDLNRKIFATLRAFRGSKTEVDVFEVDRYFQTITDATTPAQKAAQKVTAEQEVGRELGTQTVQNFLFDQNAKHSGKRGEEAGTVTNATLKHISREVEFDV